MDSSSATVETASHRAALAAAAAQADASSSDLPVIPAVLVLDDDPAVVELIGRTLGEAGYRTLFAADAERARALIQRRSVSMVFLSWRLAQRLGGEKLLADLRARSSRPRLPMIVISADHSELKAANELDITDYLPSPSHHDDLLHLVDEYCR